MTPNQVISFRLFCAAIMLNNCLKFTTCKRCEPKKAFSETHSVDNYQCPYNTYIIKSSIRHFKWCTGVCSKGCDFNNKKMHTSLIMCSISYTFFRMCSSYKNTLG